MTGFQRKTDAQLAKMSEPDIAKYYVKVLAHARGLKPDSPELTDHQKYTAKVWIARMAAFNAQGESQLKRGGRASAMMTVGAVLQHKNSRTSESRREYAASPGFQRKTDAQLSKMSHVELARHHLDAGDYKAEQGSDSPEERSHKQYRVKVHKYALAASHAAVGKHMKNNPAPTSESRATRPRKEAIVNAFHTGLKDALQNENATDEALPLTSKGGYGNIPNHAGLSPAEHARRLAASKKSFAKYGNAGKPKPIKRQRVVERLTIAYGGDVERAERAVAIYEKHNGAAMWGMAIAAGDVTCKSDPDDVHAAVLDTLHAFRTANFDPHDGDDTKHANNTDPFFVNAPGVSERRLVGRDPKKPATKIGDRPTYSVVRENAADFLRSLGRHVNESHGMSNRGPITRLEIDARDGDESEIREAVSRHGGYVSHVTNGKVFADIDEAESKRADYFHRRHADLNQAAAKAHRAAMTLHRDAHKTGKYREAWAATKQAHEASHRTEDSEAKGMAERAWDHASQVASDGNRVGYHVLKAAAGSHEHAAMLHTKTAAMHAKKAAGLAPRKS